MFAGIASIVINSENPAILCQVDFLNGSTFSIQSGSVLDFVGDVIVNAANNGGVGGFGLDEMVNRAAGDYEIKEARKAFGGISTGEAKVTSSFKHTKVNHIIHAVGPVYRQNRLQKDITVVDLDSLLTQAYFSSLQRAVEVNATSIGFCLLSAGVFRGEKPLEDVILIGVRAILSNMCDPVRNVVLFAFTEEEQRMSKIVGKMLQSEFNASRREY